MKDVTRRISLDFTRKGNTRVIFASEADFNSREFIISLFEDGVPYPVEQSGFATINVCRADGERAGYIADITDDGCVRYVAGRWPFEVAGDVKFSVSLFDGDKKRLTSNSFTVSVEEGLYIGGDIAESDKTHSFFDDLISAVAQFKNQETQRRTAENERAQKESERAGAESARADAEGEREARELERAENELARQRAEEARVANENQRIEITETLKNSLGFLIMLQERYIEEAGKV